MYGSIDMSTKPQRIIHIITGLEVGGAESMLKRLLLSDPDSKNTALIISLSGLGVLGKQLVQLDYQVHAFHFQKLSSLIKDFCALVKLIKVNRPAIVQTWMYHADFFGGLAARMAGCHRVVWGIRTTFIPPDSKRTFWLMRLCALLSYLVPKKIICVAEAAKKIHVAYGYQSKKIHVIPNGFDFSCFDVQQVDTMKIRNELGLSAEDLVIGCVGRMHLDKGQDLFISATALLEKKRMYFILVGRGCDTANNELMKQIDSYGLRDSFILLGERHDIPECLSALDIFCMPSRTEGFPNGLGEAMCMGLPCVATRVGDTEVLTGETVELVAPDDPIALAAGLTKLINMHPDDRYHSGMRAASRVRDQFSIDKTRTRFYDLYQELWELTS